MRRVGFGVKKGLQPTMVARGGRKRGRSGSNLSVVDLWRGVEWLWWNCEGGEGGGSIQCMQFHFSYISPPTNPQTHPHQDTKIGIIFPELISLCRFQATVYLEHSCYILISVFLGVGNIDR